MNDASKSRKSLPAPPETPNITAPVRGKGVAPLSCTPTMENGLGSSILLPHRSLRCQSDEYATKRRVNKRQNQHSITAIAHITEHFSSRTTQNTSSNISISSISSINDASTRRKPPSEPPETPNITAPVRGKRVVPLSCTPMDGRWTSALRLPVRPQFTASESEEYTGKRRS